MSAPRLGLILPTSWGDSSPDAAALMAFARRAEELGFDSLWVIDRIFHARNLPHPLTALTYAAAATNRIGLGTAVILLGTRHPVEVAQQAASLNALSGERLTLGVSLGGRDNEYLGMNMPANQRVGRLLEGTQVIRRLLSEDKVNFDGRYYTLQDATINPKPKVPGGIRMPFGASTEASLRRAGRHADGWIQGGRGDPASFGRAWQTVMDSAAVAGRDTAGLINGKLLYGNPGETATASAELEAYLSNYYGPGYPMEQTACGSPQQIAERILAYGEAGCQLVMLGLPGADLKRLELIAEQVLPLLPDV